jgi:hypothetical protein
MKLKDNPWEIIVFHLFDMKLQSAYNYNSFVSK